MTIDEAKKKWEKKLWDAYDKVAHYDHIGKFSPYALEGDMERFVKMLHQIGCDGFSVRTFFHVNDKSMRGMYFMKLDPEDVRWAREVYKVKYEEEPWATQESK